MSEAMEKSKLIQWLEAAESAVPDLTPWRSNEVDEEPLIFAHSHTLGLWVAIGFADYAWTDTRLREWETALPHKSPAELCAWLAKAWTEKAEGKTRPRRTLADVVANPPEGWEANTFEGGAQFVRRNASGHILAIFGWVGGKVVNDWVAVTHPGQRQPMTPAERAAIHRAVADLLDLLAEVSDV